jgi:hypothetical protein
MPSLRDSTLFQFCFPALKRRAFIDRRLAAEASGDFRLFAVLVVATQIRPSRHQTKSKVIYNVAMRRPLTIAAFVVVLLVALVSASAQRGGMRSSGGGRGGAVGRPSGGGHGIGIGRSIGGTSGSHAFGGMHAGLGSRLSFRGDRFGGGRFHSSGFRHCFGCRRGFGYPWYGGYGYAGYYDPYWWWDSSSSYDYDQERDLAQASEMNALSVEEQRLREQEDREQARDQDLYARRSQPREEERSAALPATALVFRDQHVEEVRNYAIAGGTLWVLNDHQAGKKIPLAQLDLDATVKMNDDRGLDFQVPK